jgi:hypothetical protein
MDIRYYWLRDAVERRKISVQYLPTQEMVADIFTKALPKGKLETCRELLGLKFLSKV